jgi:hypothetical protein
VLGGVAGLVLLFPAMLSDAAATLDDVANLIAAYRQHPQHRGEVGRG